MSIHQILQTLHYSYVHAYIVNLITDLQQSLKRYRMEDSARVASYREAAKRYQHYRHRGEARRRAHPKELGAMQAASESMTDLVMHRRRGLERALALKWDLYSFVFGMLNSILLIINSILLLKITYSHEMQVKEHNNQGWNEIYW